jgi:hypothetical protein
MAFSIIPKEEIIEWEGQNIRYNTEGSTLLGYTEAVKINGQMCDELLFQGKNGRKFLTYQRPERLKNGDNSSRIQPVNKEEAIRHYKDLAVYSSFKLSETETTDIFDFDRPIKA